MTRGKEDGLLWPLRRATRVNESIWRGLYKPGQLAPDFPAPAGREPKVNGMEGMRDISPSASWQLSLETSGRARMITMDDIRSLPSVESTTELKCIEGWSQVVSWGGVRFSDFANRYGVKAKYVYLATPQEGYFVGIDMESMRHPQTLLAFEMNGKPLTNDHGAPLRLVIPVKYGIKNIKRIGLIRFTDERPKDFWEKEGYDWYVGM